MQTKRVPRMPVALCLVTQVGIQKKLLLASAHQTKQNTQDWVWTLNAVRLGKKSRFQSSVRLYFFFIFFFAVRMLSMTRTVRTFVNGSIDLSCVTPCWKAELICFYIEIWCGKWVSSGFFHWSDGLLTPEKYKHRGNTTRVYKRMHCRVFFSCETVVGIQMAHFHFSHFFGFHSKRRFLLFPVQFKVPLSRWNQVCFASSKFESSIIPLIYAK